MQFFQRNRQKDAQSNHTGKRKTGRVRRIVLREGEHLLWLLPYLYTLFSILFYPHPGLHYLAATGFSIVLGALLCGQIEHLFRIWTQDSSAPPVRYLWRHVCETLL